MYNWEEARDRINAFVDNLKFEREPLELYKPIRYTLAQSGKRVRPVLCLMAYNLYKDNIEEVLYPAVAMETYHNYTLIHDDVMDRADIRRGKPTVCAKWGDTAAILSGDTMLVLAYEFIAHAPTEKLPAMLALFTETAKEVGDGQQYDLDFENRDNVAEEEYMEMIRLKTSVLIAASLKMGGIVAGASDEDLKNLYAYGETMGLAFQLQDDLLDSYGDERLGKKIGGDILEGKKTILMIEAFSRANEEQREVLRTTHLRKDLSDAEKIATIKSLYDALGVPERVERQIAQKFQKAIAILDNLSVDVERTAELRKYAENLVGRKS